MVMEAPIELKPLAVSNGALDAFKQRDAALNELVAKNKNLAIKGLEDRAGYRAIDAGRIELKKARVSIENDRKSLKEGALVYGRAVDKEAARLTAIVETEELRLKAMTDAIDAEKAAKAQAVLEEKRALARQRQDEFRALGACPPFGYEDMGQAEYDEALATAKLAKAKADQEAEVLAHKQAEEAARLKADREAHEAKVAAERAEIDRERAAQKAREDAVRAEQDRVRQEQEARAAELRAHEQRIKDQETAQRRAVELEEAKRAAAERAVQEEKERAAREAEAKEAAEFKRRDEEAKAAFAAEEARKKAEEEKPLREKILDVANRIDVISVPSIGLVAMRIEKVLLKASSDIRKIANGPLE